MSHKPSVNLDSAQIGEVRLTLATWQPNPEYPPSFEIGYRYKNDFRLIQWRILPSKVAWSIVQRLVKKDRNIFKIKEIISRIEREK